MVWDGQHQFVSPGAGPVHLASAGLGRITGRTAWHETLPQLRQSARAAPAPWWRRVQSFFTYAPCAPAILA